MLIFLNCRMPHRKAIGTMMMMMMNLDVPLGIIRLHNFMVPEAGNQAASEANLLLRINSTLGTEIENLLVRPQCSMATKKNSGKKRKKSKANLLIKLFIILESIWITNLYFYFSGSIENGILWAMMKYDISETCQKNILKGKK